MLLRSGFLPGAGAQLVGFGDGRGMSVMPSPMYPGTAQRRRGARVQPGKLTPNRFALGLPIPAHLSSDKQLPGLEIQSEFDQTGIFGIDCRIGMMTLCRLGFPRPS